MNTHVSRNEMNFKKCKVITKFLQKREKETTEENEFISIKEPSEYLKRVQNYKAQFNMEFGKGQNWVNEQI